MREVGPRVRIGIVGAGATCQLMHLPILSERPDVEVAALSDLDQAKARAVADRFGVSRVTTDDDIIGDPEIGGVVICAPSFLHEFFAIRCLNAGKHVLVERPAALSADGVGDLLAAARRADRGVVAGFSHRYQANVRALRSAVMAGAVGSVGLVRVAWMNRAVRCPRTGWRRRALESGGGALMDLGVLALDLALWVLGSPEVERVAAVTHGDGFDVEEEAHLQAVTADGTAVSLAASWRFHSPTDMHALEVLGSEGTARLSPLTIHKVVGGRTVDATPRQPVPRGGENHFTNGYRRLLDDFVRVVGGTARARALDDQVTLMRVIEGAYESARDGREVRLG